MKKLRIPGIPTPSLLTICLLLAIPATAIGNRLLSANELNSQVGQTATDEKPEKSGGKENPRYSYRRIHDPNGIGKFYMGREIAHVMGFGFQGSGARWLERAEREREERLKLLVKSLVLKPDMTVADIGAGSGVVSLLLASQIGEDGQVLAVDIQQEMLDRLKKRAKNAGIGNIKTIKGTERSPRLPAGKVDLVIMVDVYHEFEYPYEMMLEIARSLKPGGRVAFVEYRMEDPTVPIKLIHKMSEAQVKKEAAAPEFGLKFQKTIGVLPRQHIVVFEKKPSGK